MESVWRNCVLFVKAAPPPPRSGANRPGLEKAFKARPVRISGTVHISPSLLLRLFQRRRRPFLSAFFPSRQRWQKFQESGSASSLVKCSPFSRFHSSKKSRLLSTNSSIVSSRTNGPSADNRRHSTPRKVPSSRSVPCRHHHSEPCRSFGKAVQAAPAGVHRHLDI